MLGTGLAGSTLSMTSKSKKRAMYGNSPKGQRGIIPKGYSLMLLVTLDTNGQRETLETLGHYNADESRH